MRPFFILITAILAVFIVISAHVYMGSGLFAGLFTFTIYYLAWELTIWRLRAILQSDHRRPLRPRHEVHITTDYLKDDKQDWQTRPVTFPHYFAFQRS